MGTALGNIDPDSADFDPTTRVPEISLRSERQAAPYQQLSFDEF